MFSQSEGSSSVAPTISVTVTALTRPSSLGAKFNPLTVSSSVPVIDTPTITNIVLSALEGVQSGVPTRTTPTLTPTTLKNIEQLFETPSVQPPEVHFNQAGFVPPPVQITSDSSSEVPTSHTIVSIDSKAWGGGVTTLGDPSILKTTLPVNTIRVVTPAPSSSSNTSRRNSPSVSPMPVANQILVTRRTGGRKPQIDDSLSPEEEERRLMRRERNKQAAARCRKRRLDQTNLLQDETESLQCKRESLQQEIQLLQQQREELEFLLAAHKSTCKVGKGSRHINQFSQLEIKEEPVDFNPYGEPIIPPKIYTKAPASIPTPRKLPRPTSLNISSGGMGGITDLGVAIETPSSGLRGLGLNFDSMMEGGTGLTPVTPTPLQPVSTSLTTPIVSVVPSSNCATQLRSSSAELASPDSLPHKLVSL